MKPSSPFFALLFFVFTIAACSKSDDGEGGEDILPTLTFQSVSIEEGEDEKPIFIDFRLDMAATSEVSFFISTEDGSAKEGEDFSPIKDQEVIIRPGASRKEVRLVILGDNEMEGDEVFFLNVTDLSGASAATMRVEVTIENDDISIDYDIPPAGYTTPSSYPGYKLMWQDEFDGSSLNEDDWTFEQGNGRSGWGNKELQFYRRENTDIHEGHLVIQAREETFGGFNYTSSRIKTQRKVNFTHGRVDIRAALPEGQGIWPALWMLGENITDVGWPRCGEIDIMEIVGHEPGTLHGTVHYANPDGVHLFTGGKTVLPGGARFSSRFHVFSIIWKEDLIEWYLDDVKYFTVTPSILGSGNPYPFNEPFFLIFNVAVGGNWPGSPDGTTVFPQNMYVDYVRVFQEE
jgi:beta-glucanase (GH16 family)